MKLSTQIVTANFSFIQSRWRDHSMQKLFCDTEGKKMKRDKKTNFESHFAVIVAISANVISDRLTDC